MLKIMISPAARFVMAKIFFRFLGLFLRASLPPMMPPRMAMMVRGMARVGLKSPLRAVT